MAEVRTHDEALASVDSALQSWSVEVTGLLVQAQSVVGGAQAEATAAVRRIFSHIAVLEALLTAADQESRLTLQSRLRRAHEALGDAQRALALVAQVEASVRRLSRVHTTASNPHVANARAQLAAMKRAIGDYRSSGRGIGGNGVPGGPSTAAKLSTEATALAEAGLTGLDVRAADLDENPVLDDNGVHGTFGKGGLSRSDYRWAVQTWDDTVGPGVAAGKSRQDFVDRDARSNAQPPRRTADVYDMFLGSERIRVDRRPDGSLNIVNGRHRLLIARELGIKSLPGQVSG